MKTKREFLGQLYARRISYVAGWKLIQQNKEFRNGLFLQYMEGNHDRIQTVPLIQELDKITDSIVDFKKRPLTSQENNSAGYGEAFAKTLIRKLESTGCPNLGAAILEDFLSDGDNHTIESRVRKYSPAYYQAFTNYREIKMYADGFINDHLKTVTPTTKPVQTGTSFPAKGRLNTGRPKAETKEAKDLLKKIDDENKNLFLSELKREFGKSDKKTLAHLLITLDQMKLVIADCRKTLYLSMKKYFEAEFGAYANITKHWSNPDERLVNKITERINEIKETMFYNRL